MECQDLAAIDHERESVVKVTDCPTVGKVRPIL